VGLLVLRLVELGFLVGFLVALSFLVGLGVLFSLLSLFYGTQVMKVTDETLGRSITTI
jgi:hypothetical protein